MKKILISLSLLISSVTFSFAQEICVAQKKHLNGYASFLHYEVECNNNIKFKTENIMTMALIPIPYHWGNVARKKLFTEMNRRGLKEVSVMDRDDWLGISGDEPIRIFDKNNNGEKYCAVLKYDTIKATRHNPIVVFNALVFCEATDSRIILKEYTHSELKKYMEERNYKKAVEVNFFKHIDFGGGRDIYGNKPLKSSATVEIYKEMI